MDLSNLVAHWRLDEASGSRTDVHGSHTMLATGLPPSSTGKVGDAVNLDGVGMFLYNSDTALMSGDSTFEMNGWVKFDTLAANKAVLYSGGITNKFWMLYTDGVNLKFTVSDNGASWTTEVTSTILLSAGAWYFFRFWHDATNNQIAIKVNAEAINYAAHTTGIYSSVFLGPYLNLGYRIDTAVYADVEIDSLSYWTRILSDSESLVVWNAGNGLDYPWPSSSTPSAISFFEAITRPTLTPIVLAEVTVGIWSRAWIQDGTHTNTYKVSAERENARGETFSLNITSVQWNLTTELTEKTSAADVNSNAGSWYCDGEFLWVNPVSGSIFDNTVQAFATFYFSQNGKVLNDIFWEPRLNSVPALTQRIEAVFGGVGQIGGGSISLMNHDGLFNQMQDFQWHHGTVVLRLGIDLPKNQEMDWSDYQVIATWTVRDWKRDETMFTLTVEEPKAKIKTKVPFEFFSRDDYPNIEDSLVGKPIPIAYGSLFGIKPILIDPGAKQFKVAGHAIKSFDGVRIKTTIEQSRTITTAVGEWHLYSGAVYRYYLQNEEAKNVTYNGTSLTKSNSVDDCVATAGTWTESENWVYVNPSSGATIGSGTYAIIATKTADSWQSSNFASVDTANGQFTLGNDWAVGTDVSVDFRGKIGTDGLIIENPADIIEDLLSIVGETNLDSASFADAASVFTIGTDENGSNVFYNKPSVYIDSAKEVLEIISLINEVAGCFMFSDELGRFHLGAFEPQPGDALPLFNDLDLMDFEELTESAETISKFVTSYQTRTEDGYSQVKVIEETANQYIAGQNQPVVEERSLEMSSESDADYWTRRNLIMRGFPLKRYTFRLPWNALLRKPGEQIHIQSDQRQLDEVLEILEVRRDLSSKQVTLVVGNLRNFTDTPGFWVDDAAVLPARFAELAGYGVGDLTWDSTWDSQIKKWARQNVGYWTDANGFANTSDPESFLPSVWV